MILRRSGTQKNQGEISPPLWEISGGILGKGKKSIDLESVVGAEGGIMGNFLVQFCSSKDFVPKRKPAKAGGLVRELLRREC